MNKRGMSIFSIAILTIALSIGIAVSYNTGFDVEKFNSNLNWTNVNVSVLDQPEISNSLNYYINGLGAAFFEIAKWVAKWSAQNPQVPYKLLLYLLLISLLMPIIYYGFIMLIIIFLLTKEWLAKRKETKKLKEYNGNRERD